MPGPTLIRPGFFSTGLQGHWILNEASGVRVDSSPNGNDLTDNNTVLSVAQDYWRTGENSADFEESNSEYLSIADGSQVGLDITGAISFSAFVRIESATDNNPVLTKWDESLGSQKSFDFGVNSSSLVYFNGSSDGSSEVNVVSTGFTVPLGKWSHIACVYDGSFITLYLNGNVVAVTAYASGFFNSTSPFWIGRQHRSVSAYMDGVIKDAAIWNVALTPSQIKSIALGVDIDSLTYRPDDVSTPPTAWWKLNEISSGAGAISRLDSSGNGRHLTDNNTIQARAGYMEGAGANLIRANSEYLSVADATAWDIVQGTGFSLSFWTNHSTLVDGQTYIGHFETATANWAVQYSSTLGVRFFLSNGSFGNLVTTGGSGVLALNTWHHVCITYNGGTGTFKTYLDGVLKDTHVDADAGGFTGPLEIGRRTTAGEYLDAQLSDMALWRGYELTPAEVASLASGIPLQQSGVVSYWKLDEASGTRVDSIGANDLTDNNTVLAATGQVGDAADFERDNTEYLSITDASQSGLDLVSQYSLLAWIKRESNADEVVLAKDNGEANGYRMITTSSSTVTAQINNSGGVSSTGISLSNGVWYHIASVFTEATLALYFNGGFNNSASQTALPVDNVHEFRIGRSYTDAFDGLIDEALVAARWFRDEEIKTVYNKGLNGKEATSEEVPEGPGTGVFNRGLFLTFPV